MPRADLALMVFIISTRAPRVNVIGTAGQALSEAQLEKSLLARYSLEICLIYYHTCKHLFVNCFIEAVLQSAGEQGSESCSELALAKPLSANELHPGNISFAWGTTPQSFFPEACQILGTVASVERGGTVGQITLGQCWDVLLGWHLQRREATPASLHLISLI